MLWRAKPMGERMALLYLTEDVPCPGSSPDPAALARRIAAAGLPWVIGTVPAYETVAVNLDADRLPAGRLGEEAEAAFEEAMGRLLRLAELAPEEVPAGPSAMQEADGSGGARTVSIPVEYGGEAGPDLAEAASRSGLSEEEFIRRHSSSEYSVAMIGFTPGFPYLRGLPGDLAQPRRETPRLSVPAGSVGIAGLQTGIYPVASPGGWQLVGRTPERLFRPESDEPFPIRPGDTVRFVPVKAGAEAAGSLEERGGGSSTESLEKSSNGSLRGRLKENGGEASGAGLSAIFAEGAWEEGAETVMTVLRPGLQTTIQDLGRTGGGWQAFGVSAGGAMDKEALRAANLLVGNDEGAAGLELTLSGGEYRVERDMLVALTGADLGATAGGERLPTGRPTLLRAGAVLRFRGGASGCRAYLAAAGGFAARPMLGSRSADLRASIGGAYGRALRPGDELRAASPSAQAQRLQGRLRESAPAGAAWHAGREYARCERDSAGSGVGTGSSVVLRVLEGTEWDWFAESARQDFFAGEYRVGADSDRMGVRLSGEPLRLERQAELLSHGVCAGAIQVPASGQPIALGQGCQPTGGYPIIAIVAAADLGLLAQLRPGDRIRFEAIGLRDALRAYREKQEGLAQLAAGIRLKWYR
ncbi:5-oxoprolinase subunit PxpB [Cohnella fermenti]|nr:5-oxoprolinase subunit PxpB [Cohnella fermenti]